MTNTSRLQLRQTVRTKSTNKGRKKRVRSVEGTCGREQVLIRPSTTMPPKRAPLLQQLEFGDQCYICHKSRDTGGRSALKKKERLDKLYHDYVIFPMLTAVHKFTITCEEVELSNAVISSFGNLLDSSAEFDVP